MITTLGAALAEHDRLYIHDASLLYHFVYEQIPTVVSFHDFVYSEPLIGSLSFRRDHLVLNSAYLHGCASQVFDKFRPLPQDRVTIVPNGFDLTEFRWRDPQPLMSELGIPGDTIAILYPHRPDVRKGIWESIDITMRVIERMPVDHRDRVKLLVPVWLDANLPIESRHPYQQIYRELADVFRSAGLSDTLVLHEWLPPDRMAEYYSMGAVTLCVGSFIESFGCVSVESQLCGTPAIVSRVGAQRSVLPDELINKVDYDDRETAAEIALAAVNGERIYDSEALRSYVSEYNAPQ